MLRECWQFRDFILASVKRDFAARYLGTQLGLFWAIAQPLAMIFIYTLVFSTLMRPSLPEHASRFAYTIYLCAGIVHWQLFSEVLNRSIGIFVHNAGLLKKVSLPKLALPVVVVLSGLSNFSVVFAVFSAFLLATGSFPWSSILAILPVVALLTALALGLGVLLGTVNVFYRDVEPSVAILLQLWFWLTPIVYISRVLPDYFAAALAWNPLVPIIDFAHAILLEDRVPAWSTLVYPAEVAVVLLALGVVAFRRLGSDIVDEL